ncbi:LysE family transporter, partial [Streptomyces sp. PRKS01-29]
MVDTSSYAAFLLAAFVLRVTPGPDMMFIVAMGRRRAFWQGALVNLLNPQVVLFNIAFLPQFVHPGLGHVPGQFLLLGITIVVMGCCADGSIGLLPGKLAGLLGRSRRVARGLNVFSGTVFTGLAIPVSYHHLT